jgi:molybdopterin-containing oxidoreductase family membrane subunit
MTAAAERHATIVGYLPPSETDTSITERISDAVLKVRVGRVWWLCAGVAAAFTLALLIGILVLFNSGIGIMGVNSVDVWGYFIANYVWWIGIGNAGTLISALLLLTRQSWRASINRFAEAMTLFAVSIAGLFPILHLGRPQYFYWLAPYPNVMALWPQWRSALVWDFWAILSYLLFSIVFWYVGVIPDLATLRDRATTRLGQLAYGAFALGWRGSARHWARYERYYTAMAALAVPLVCSVHSIVGLDFAASLEPGWAEPIYPPYFVVGAMYSGFAMVVLLAAAMRWGFRLQTLVTDRHFEVMGRVMLMAAIVMGLSYATEWFMAWYGGDHAERDVVVFQFTGAYAPIYWALLFCNVFAPQILWLPAARRSLPVMIAVSLLILIGMWLERILIVWMTLSHDFMPSAHRLYYPTFWDWLFLFAPFGFFALLFLIFARVVPVIAMHDVRRLRREEAAG